MTDPTPSTEELADPTARYIQREVSEAMNRTGMQAGLPKVRLDASKAQRLIDLYAAALSRAEALEQQLAEARWQNDRAFWIRPDGEQTTIPPEPPSREGA